MALCQQPWHVWLEVLFGDGLVDGFADQDDALKVDQFLVDQFQQAREDLSTILRLIVVGHYFLKYHVRYLSHLALLVGSNKLVSTPFKDDATLAPKLANPLGSQSTWMAPPLITGSSIFDPDQLSFCTILHLSVRWNTWLRNQISLIQHIFYYKSIVSKLGLLPAATLYSIGKS